MHIFTQDFFCWRQGAQTIMTMPWAGSPKNQDLIS